MCIFLQDGVLIKPNLPTKKLTWTSNKCFKGRLNFIDILFGENTRFVLLALPATIRYFTNPCYINPCYQQNAQLIKVKESNIKSICRQQLFCSLRAHQHSSNQMKILKDQSAQTTARFVNVAYCLWSAIMKWHRGYAICRDKFLEFLHQHKFLKLYWTFNSNVWSNAWVLNKKIKEQKWWIKLI